MATLIPGSGPDSNAHLSVQKMPDSGTTSQEEGVGGDAMHAGSHGMVQERKGEGRAWCQPLPVDSSLTMPLFHGSLINN